MATRYIAVEGNIGAGKSTLAKLLAGHYSAPLILEQFADNPFLPKFYSDAERYSLPLELSFLADRYQQLTKDLEANAGELFVVADYIFAKSDLFASVNLTGDELVLFRSYFSILNNNLPVPDVLVFLDAPVDVLLRNIKQRGRSYEQDIQPAYLDKIQSIYRHYISTLNIPVVIIDHTAIDFVTHPQYLRSLAAYLALCTEQQVYHFNV